MRKTCAVKVGASASTVQVTGSVAVSVLVVVALMRSVSVVVCETFAVISSITVVVLERSR